MDKIFRVFENVINAIMVLIGVASVIGGIVTGMWHCYLIGVMTFAIPYVTWNERR